MHALLDDSSRRYALLELSWTHARDGHLAINTNSALIVEANDAFLHLSGYSRDELIGMHISQVHPEHERPFVLTTFPEESQQPQLIQGLHIRRKDGTIFPVAISNSGPRLIDGTPITMAVFRDIAEMTANEDRLARRNWALAAFARCTEALLSSKSTDILLNAICQAITAESSYVLAWIGLAVTDDRKSIHIAASAGSSIHYLDDAAFTWAEEVEAGRGPAGQAIRTQRPHLMLDCQQDPSFRLWQERAQHFGINTILSAPFLISPGLPGVLMVCAADPIAFDTHSIDVFHSLATQIGLGLFAIQQEARLNEKREQLARSHQQFSDALSKTIGAMAVTMEMRDPYTAGHESRVADLCVAIGKKLGWPQDRLEALHLAGIVHDIGKIIVPIEILTKPTRLTAAEFTIIKEHPETAYKILKDIPFTTRIPDFVRQHHEKLDGSGYPLGISGDAVLPESRVLAVADIVEAMSSARPYRAPLGVEAALKEVESLAVQSRLDPEVVRICCDLFRNEHYTFPAPNY